MPTCSVPGVHAKWLLTGFPVTGRLGVMVTPAGRPHPFSVTLWPLSGSELDMVKLKVRPASTNFVIPQVGAAPSSWGIVPTDGTSWMKKSTAIVLFTRPAASTSSTVTCVE